MTSRTLYSILISYLELQIHGEIRFDRDVDELVVDWSDINPTGEKLAAQFAKQFGCKVTVFQSGRRVCF